MSGTQESSASDTSGAPGAGPVEPRGGGRLDWADAAKGCCIILVVLWHVVNKDLKVHSWADGQLVRDWELSTLWLIPLRMPLFFVVSGVFAASAMTRPWRLVLRGRSVKLYWVFVLWVVIQIPVFLAVPAFPTGHITTPGQLLAALTYEPPNVWYLYALAWYVVVARLLVRLPTPAVLVPALVLSSVAATGVLPLTGNATAILQYLFFFLAGLRLRGTVVRVAEAANGRRLALSSAVFAVCATGLLFLPGWWIDVLEPLVGLSAVHAGVTAVALVVDRGRLGRPLAALGRRTLPVYVLHMPFVALLFLAGEQVDLGAVVLVYPVVATALVCLAALGLERALRAAGCGGWLFDLPGPVARFLTPASGRS